MRRLMTKLLLSIRTSRSLNLTAMWNLYWKPVNSSLCACAVHNWPKTAQNNWCDVVRPSSCNALNVRRLQYKILTRRVCDCDQVLLSACWMSLRIQMLFETQPHVDIYVRLASVCRQFYEVIRDKRFRRIIRRNLNGLSRFTL